MSWKIKRINGNFVFDAKGNTLLSAFKNATTKKSLFHLH
jgi:hypothetical protein